MPASNSPAGLRVESVTLGYKGRDVLREVSLEGVPGEILGVLGPNGCGKSTLIRGISRVTPIRGGRVFIGEKNVAGLAREALARMIAVVPQNPELPPAFTVFEVVLMGRTPHLRRFQNESDRDVAIATVAMEATGVEELASRRMGDLSGGERQRVTIARALAQQAQVMLLDEPTANLDINYQVQIMDLVRKLCHEGGLSVLMALHDLNLAAQYCDHIVMLNRGSVYVRGTPAAVITREAIREVYGVEVYVSSHPVNSLPATMVLPGKNGANWAAEKQKMG